MARSTGFSEDDLAQFAALYRDERASAALYRELAGLSAEHAALLEELAATEERHADHWDGLLRAEGRTPEPAPMPWRHRLLVWRARRFGVDHALPAVIRGEAAARDRYRANPYAPDRMAEEEAGHGRALALASHDNVGEGLALADARHRITAGGALRAAVFGVNDGLVSNLALIMGVAGGTTDPAVIVLAGVAGLVAGAGSMAAGEWVSVRSQRELYERELSVERWELEQFPDDECHELELIYRGKGMPAKLAAAVAKQIMTDPDVALDTLAREELGLNPGDLGSPWAAAVSSFVAFALGALVPLVPFLFAVVGTGAVVASALMSALALAGVGAILSVFTGRPAWRSSLRMVLIGGGAAVVTYLIGALVGVTLD
ncbi:MAG TPA: VIT1/CCC1 transporter family protein [Euzebyales bacterium]